MPLMFTPFEILDMLGKEAGRENRLDEMVADVAIWAIRVYQAVPEEAWELLARGSGECCGNDGDKPVHDSR